MTETIAGYRAISIPYATQEWGGLEPSGAYALMDGSVNSENWFYAVGAFQTWRGGMPGYVKSLTDYDYPQQSVELYVEEKSIPVTVFKHAKNSKLSQAVENAPYSNF